MVLDDETRKWLVEYVYKKARWVVSEGIRIAEEERGYDISRARLEKIWTNAGRETRTISDLLKSETEALFRRYKGDSVKIMKAIKKKNGFSCF